MNCSEGALDPPLKSEHVLADDYPGAPGGEVKHHRARECREREMERSECPRDHSGNHQLAPTARGSQWLQCSGCGTFWEREPVAGPAEPTLHERIEAQRSARGLRS